VLLEAFGVKDLRCLAATGLVPIRPITVLVGRNSSGKSTFLRAFPLLRQSVETPRDSPILWYHDRYVDFGSLKAAANNRLPEPGVTFQFELKLWEPAEHEPVPPRLHIAMTLGGDETPYVSGYTLRLDAHEVQWELDADGRGVGGRAPARPVRSGLWQRPDQPGTAQRPAVPRGTARRPVQNRAYLLPPLDSGGIPETSYQAVPEKLGLPDVQLIKNWWLINWATGDGLNDIAPVVIRAADDILASIMSRVAYLAPLRVSAARAYRIQNLAVNEVDPDGSNLAMFLRALSNEESSSFAAFTRDALDFETRVATTGLHAEILLRGRGAKQFTNLVDVGFGYSEVLPLAAILWASCIQPAMRGQEPAPIVAIEQPELHLHPAHQARLARMLVEAVRASRAASVDRPGAAAGGSSLLVETHSESLINGLGKLVYEGAIKADDVQIVLFDQDDETGETAVRLAGYRENGALRDWPYGFLSPVAERRAPLAAAE